MKKCTNQFCLLVLILATAFISPSPVHAQMPEKADYNPFAEEWIAYQIATGKVADLAQHYPNPDDRVIRGSFVVSLLQNRSGVTMQTGAAIKNATVIGDLVLQHAEVDFPVSFESINFEGFVSFCRVHFYSSLSITLSTFKSGVNFCAAKSEDLVFFNDSKFEASADFTGADIKGDLALQKASFAGIAKFGGAKIQGSLFLDDATFNDPSQTIAFDNIHVDGSIFLNRTSFSGSARFMDAYMGSHFAADDVKFTSPDGNVNFENMFVGKSIYLNRAVFNSAVNFSTVAVEYSFIANNAQFNNTKEATFSRLKVGKILYLQNAVFAGPVNFDYMDIASLLDGTGIHFNSQDGLVNFGESKVGSHIFLNKGIFAGPVRFNFLEVKKNFEAQSAQFTNVGQQASFRTMKVGEFMALSQAVFSGSANFDNVQIGNSLNADGAYFNDSKDLANFSRLRAQFASFEGTVFLGPVNFAYSDIDFNLILNKAQFKSLQEKVELGKMKIGGSLYMSETVFDGAVSFDYSDIGDALDLSNSRFNNSNEQTASLADMNVHGYIFLNGAAFNGPLSLARTKTKGLFAGDATWPKEQNVVNVMGLVYDEVDIHDSQGRVDFISLLGQSPFEIQSYWRLENFYRNKGRPELADHVYVIRKHRERGQGEMHWYYWRWLWNSFLDIFILYGRDPIRVLLWSLLFVVLGYFVFHKKEKMRSVVETDRRYRPFLYSLDLFLPLVDLGYAKLWKPCSERRFARVYAKIHQYIAWILIPIALLAIARVFD